jgi:hypothetical protein
MERKEVTLSSEVGVPFDAKKGETAPNVWTFIGKFVVGASFLDWSASWVWLASLYTNCNFDFVVWSCSDSHTQVVVAIPILILLVVAGLTKILVAIRGLTERAAPNRPPPS